jgi:uncharacterized protein (TIGR03435 family)
MATRLILFVLVTFAVSLARAAEPVEPLRVGDIAPELTVEKVLQAPDGADTKLAALRGKVVILHFWGPHSQPCITSFAHLSKLATSLKDLPVQFICIAAIDEQTLSRFKETTPIPGWIGVDQDRWTFCAYSASPVPHTVVIDPAGKIAAITQPENVTASAVKDLLAGKALSLPLQESKPVEPAEPKREDKEDPKPVYEVIMTPIEGRESGARVFNYRPHQGSLRIGANPLEILVATAYNVPLSSVVNKLPRSKTMYKVSIQVPPTEPDRPLVVLRKVLRDALGIRVREEKRMGQGFALRRMEGKPLGLQESKAKRGDSFFTAGFVGGKKNTSTELAGMLAALIERPVIDETHATGKYDFAIRYSPQEPESLTKALNDLGLELVPRECEVRSVVIEKGKQREL